VSSVLSSAFCFLSSFLFFCLFSQSMGAANAGLGLAEADWRFVRVFSAR
jgi:hypothetical protein